MLLQFGFDLVSNWQGLCDVSVGCPILVWSTSHYRGYSFGNSSECVVSTVGSDNFPLFQRINTYFNLIKGFWKVFVYAGAHF